jgi:hypothetical protein
MNAFPLWLYSALARGFTVGFHTQLEWVGSIESQKYCQSLTNTANASMFFVKASFFHLPVIGPNITPHRVLRTVTLVVLVNVLGRRWNDRLQCGYDLDSNNSIENYNEKIQSTMKCIKLKILSFCVCNTDLFWNPFTVHTRRLSTETIKNEHTTLHKVANYVTGNTNTITLFYGVRSVLKELYSVACNIKHKVTF